MKEFGKYVFYSAVSAIVFLLIYIALFQPSSIVNTYEDIKDSISERASNVQEENTQNDSNPVVNRLSSMDKCQNNYEKYSKIGENKYGFDHSLIEIRKINSKSEAAEFWDLYKNAFSPTFEVMEQLGIQNNIQVYPITMVATRITSNDIVAPIVIICDHNGELDADNIKRLTA